MLGLLEVYQKGAGGGYSEGEAVDGETLEGVDLELPLQLFDRAFIDERPFFEGRDIIMVSVFFLDTFFISAGNEKFLRGEAAEEGADIVEGAFRYLEGTC